MKLLQCANVRILFYENSKTQYFFLQIQKGLCLDLLSATGSHDKKNAIHLLAFPFFVRQKSGQVQSAGNLQKQACDVFVSRGCKRDLLPETQRKSLKADTKNIRKKLSPRALVVRENESVAAIPFLTDRTRLLIDCPNDTGPIKAFVVDAWER